MEKFDNPQLGSEIRKIRGELNQKEFGERIGATQGQVSKFEKGQMPDAKILIRIAQEGNTTVEELLSLKLKKVNGSKLKKQNGGNIKESKVDPFVTKLNKDFIKLHAYRVTGAGNVGLGLMYFFDASIEYLLGFKLGNLTDFFLGALPYVLTVFATVTHPPILMSPFNGLFRSFEYAHLLIF